MPGHERDNIQNISERDAEKINKILGCINELWDEARREGPLKRIDGEQIFDNFALDRFISDLALLLNDIESRRNIKEWISGNYARFNIEVPLMERFETL